MIKILDIEVTEDSKELVDYLTKRYGEHGVINLGELPPSIRDKFLAAVINQESIEDIVKEEKEKGARVLALAVTLIETLADKEAIHNGLKHIPEAVIPFCALNDACKEFVKIFDEEFRNGDCEESHVPH